MDQTTPNGQHSSSHQG